jgi:hypothetical protein
LIENRNENIMKHVVVIREYGKREDRNHRKITTENENVTENTYSMKMMPNIIENCAKLKT